MKTPVSTISYDYVGGIPAAPYITNYSLSDGCVRHIRIICRDSGNSQLSSNSRLAYFHFIRNALGKDRNLALLPPINNSAEK